jgi:hypothetical protein
LGRRCGAAGRGRAGLGKDGVEIEEPPFGVDVVVAPEEDLLFESLVPHAEDCFRRASLVPHYFHVSVAMNILMSTHDAASIMVLQGLSLKFYFLVLRFES